MSIHAENHAAPADACQLNGVRGICLSLIWVGGALVLADRYMREQRRYRAFSYTENVSLHSFDEMKAYVEDVEKILFPPSLLGRVCGWVHRREFIGPCAVNCFSHIANQIEQFISALQIITAKLFHKVGDVIFPRKFFRKHKESPLGFFDNHTMDDGGRYGNVPSNAAYGKTAEKQSGVVV
ncbi:hypothetical protein AD952_13585 [Acetobacter cerevisiae]|uniref:Uncharacterized protein n=1 Tax=Acetobacter cerevisiae TaxID=178900 RepID=A0A149UQK5_9PROT|nr:hypothetical protein [Acetobacter cerevisiae]KXV70175.1 hypothetical protein AD952_13585 [Acetobacter cerevisiae]